MKREYKDIDEFTQDIEEESLRDYVVDSGVLRKSDFRGMFASCIFHPNDATPSLQITANFYKCYSCGSKGGFISFVMQQKGVSFLEAINILCDYFNTKIINMKSANTEKRSKIEEEWNHYLYNMSVAPKEIQDMKKDYWPIDIGYDKSINYLVLPFTSKGGKVLGFTKRVVGPVESGIRPKWKHSSMKEGMQMEIHNLFNLGDAIQEINRNKAVVVTEGPKDVIAYRRIGINNTVCVCGTSNSRNIWSEFPNLETITMSYDNDDAGIHATIETLIELAPSYDFDNIFFVSLPEGKDPYDVKSNELKEFYANRQLALPFVVKHANENELLELYQSTALHNQFKVMAIACRIKNMSVEEVESWMHSKEKPKRKVRDKNEEEKERLLSIINGSDKQKHSIEEVNKAARLLKLKFKMKV